MLRFQEGRSLGFFGLGRQYGAGVLIECGDGEGLDEDWAAALENLATWRRERGEGARSVEIQFEAEQEHHPAVWRFIGNTFFLRRSELPDVFRSLKCEVTLADRRGEVHLELFLHGIADAKSDTPEKDCTGEVI